MVSTNQLVVVSFWWETLGTPFLGTDILSQVIEKWDMLLLTPLEDTKKRPHTFSLERKNTKLPAGVSFLGVEMRQDEISRSPCLDVSRVMFSAKVI